MDPPLTLLCPRCAARLTLVARPEPAASGWTCADCGFTARGDPNYSELVTLSDDATAEHYSLQWGGELGFLDFMQHNPAAKAVTPGAQMGWPALFEEIRERAVTGRVSVYDAACGFGGIAAEIIDQQTVGGMTYVGADIHSALDVIRKNVVAFDRCGMLLRWDITRPPPIEEKFDFAICRAALHHTPDPRASFRALCSTLKPGGKIAISVYRKKSVCREACDDALREIIRKLPTQEAFAACRQFTILGKALQAVTEKVGIEEDLPLLGIRKGQYAVQELIYYNLLKCFYNVQFAERYSTLVNYDWYHPEFAYRYELDEVKSWFAENGLRLTETQSIEAQHFLLGRSLLRSSVC